MPIHSILACRLNRAGAPIRNDRRLKLPMAQDTGSQTESIGVPIEECNIGARIPVAAERKLTANIYCGWCWLILESMHLICIFDWIARALVPSGWIKVLNATSPP
jgi:hypothetical protein